MKKTVFDSVSKGIEKGAKKRFIKSKKKKR